MSAKILALGPPLGSLKAFVDKQKALQTKHNFTLCVCVGDFFGPNTSETDTEVDDLLADRLDVPLTTYIMVGGNQLPERVQQKVDATGGEVCTNVFFVGQSGVMTTSEGVKIGAIGGDWDEQVWDYSTDSAKAPTDGEEEPPAPPASLSSSSVQLTPSLLAPVLASPLLLPATSSAPTSAAPTLASLKAPTPTGLDILLLQAPPPSISLLSPSCTKLDFAIGHGASPLADVVRRARPRYIFWTGGGEDGFWEREPFGWEGTGTGSEGRYTRAIKIGRFGGPAPEEGKKKARSFYAFSLSPLVAPFPPRPANATPNPVALPNSRGVKRDAPLESQGFIWGAQGGGGKKPRGQDREPGGPPPASYVCKICDEPGHWIQECPQKKDRPAPEGGIQQQASSDGAPPASYVCKICNQPGHYIRDCPDKTDRPAKPPPLGPAECWFCLSNPKVTKHLIVAIGTETYLTLPKGQLPPTISSSKMVQNKVTGVPELPAGAPEPSPVPGGGHVLIIPVAHHQTLLSIPKEDAPEIEQEIEQTKDALKECYKEFGCVPVAFEVGRLGGRGGHAHVQVVPVPSALASKVESAFLQEAQAMGISFSPDPASAVAQVQAPGGPDSYFRVDLPDGRKMVHLMKGGQRFDLQFGRVTLAKLMGIPGRIDWKACPQTDAEEKADAVAFKKVFGKYDRS